MKDESKDNLHSQINTPKLKFTLMEQVFGVCRLLPTQPIPEWAVNDKWFSITKTKDELSIVCPVDAIPKEVTCESDWKALKIEGPLDFGLVGILSAISTVLAKHHISIFAISTYDTDYILVKESNISTAINALTDEGYEIRK